MPSEDQRKFIQWMIECDVIAGSASYIVNGYPELQVRTLRSTLIRASGDGVDWRTIYESIYKHWDTRRPHFPDPDTMASQIASESRATICRTLPPQEFPSDR